jgi:hypothetical protein
MDLGDGWLKRYQPGLPPRRIGRLGQGGMSVASVSAESNDLLRLTFICKLGDLQRQSQLQVYFPNQL